MDTYGGCLFYVGSFGIHLSVAVEYSIKNELFQRQKKYLFHLIILTN